MPQKIKKQDKEMKKTFVTISVLAFLFLGVTSCGSSTEPVAQDTTAVVVDSTAVKDTTAVDTVAAPATTVTTTTVTGK